MPPLLRSSPSGGGRRTPSFLLLLARLASKSPAAAKPPKLKNISYYHRTRALATARAALTEYLYATRALPFSHAEQIAAHSPFALSALVAQLPSAAAAADFPRALRRFLSFRPINEFDFFFESIGLPPPSPSISPSLFLADDPSLLAAVSALAHFGFPWTRLGLLSDALRADPALLLPRLCAAEARGLPRAALIASCLTFPVILTRDADPGDEVDLLLRDLHCFFSAYDGGDNIETCLEVARRIRLFYDAGSPKGAMGKLLAQSRHVFLEHEESLLAQWLGFFARLGMKREDIGPFMLRNPHILVLDLESPSIAMPGYLLCLGLSHEEVAMLASRYPFVLGKNRLGNLPGSMQAMGLTKWLLCRIVNSDLHCLSPEFISDCPHDAKGAEEFREGLQRAMSERVGSLVNNKLEFLLHIGFGENKITARALRVLNSTRDHLQERFDCLLEMGIEYPMLCRMISAMPKLMNQSKEMLHEKLSYICNDLGYSVDYLDCFPAFLCFDLENRTKPRFRILNWLKELGLLKKNFAPATILANSEKRFMVNLYSIHPAVPKQWLECFSSRDHCKNSRKSLFSS